jgi:UDPglucose 6-dehydrogenase
MKIGIVGTGYVGLVQGVVLADFGMEVTCMDTDLKKIENLKKGILPIYEPGLKELIEKVNGRMNFTTNMEWLVNNSEVIFIAVGTPPLDDGSADLHYVINVADAIGQYMNDYKVIVDKSTVPVGTGQKVKNTIQKQLELRGKNIDFDVVSNPEFLREGKAIKDCQLPDRIVIGCESEKAKTVMKKVYDVLYLKDTPFLFTNIETAEMIKYASNAFLAVKISYINEMALLCEKVGADVQELAKAMGMDGRISPKFLNAGPGYGGSCFPKDTKAITNIAKEYNEELNVVQAAIDANEKQKYKMVDKVKKVMGDLKDKNICILGLSFKPETDDMRDAPSLDIIRGLINQGALIKAFCPQGMKEAKWRLEDISDSIIYCENEYKAAENSDALIIMTEWHQFRGMDLEKTRNIMRDNYLFDFRNIFVKHDTVRELFKYYPIGRK